MSLKYRLLAACGMVGLFGSTAHAETGGPVAERHVINLDRVELSALVDDVSIITGYTFVLHPDVGNTRVSIRSQTPVTKKEVFQIFLSTLRVHGFTAVPSGRGVYRILPEKDAVGQVSAQTSPENIFVTEVFRFNRFDALEAAQVLKPLIDPQGQIVANRASRSLVVVDYASKMPRLRNLVEQMDGSNNVKVETINLQHIPAREMEAILLEVVGKDGNGDLNGGVEISSALSSNSIVIRGDEVDLERALQIVSDLDQPPRVQDTLRVIPLKNASAEELVPILETISNSFNEATPGEGPGESATIAHHQATNSLVVSAPPEMLISLERVVDELDQRRAQVLVEAIIVEMSDDMARELGVQFLLSGLSDDSTVPFLSTNFSRSAPNLLTVAGAVATTQSNDTAISGLSSTFQSAAISSLVNLNGASVGIGGRSGDTLFGAILTALEQDTDSKVLSKPFNMVLDNGEAELLVGQEVPITTGSVLDDSASNPFTTIERREVGITLKVSPRISADDTIRLDIFQEVSSVAGAAIELNPTFNTRKVDTTVLADNGEIIVIGGLIDQVDTIVNSKVPILGDVPVMGNLFKSEGRTVGQTNLMVFIKPTIVRDRDDARAVTEDNYQRLLSDEFFREGDDKRYSINEFFHSNLGQVPGSRAIEDFEFDSE